MSLTETYVCSVSGLIKRTGAPETFRPDDGTQYIPVQVRPGVDIWSIGCVFSEVAVWSRFGWERVMEYKRLRQAEVKQRLDFDGEELFHDGRDVLQSVQDMHDNIRLEKRDMDLVTIEILRLLEDDMLLREHEPRYSAKQVFHKSRRIINAVRKMLENTATDIPSRSGEDRGSVTEFEEEPKTPPQRSARICQWLIIICVQTDQRTCWHILVITAIVN